MITCPVCDSTDVCGWWEPGLRDATWRCRACGQTWPVTPGDGVAAATTMQDRAAVAALEDVCKGAKWSKKR